MSVFEYKYYIFIISAGRTGTKFLGQQLGSIIENCYSVHEPDVLTSGELFNKNLLRKIKLFSLYQLFLGKVTGKTGIRNLSQNYLAGKYDLSQLKKAVIQHRQKYYENIQEDFIIESYSGWYGCIPAIQSLYKNYKIVIISRDPRAWVTSNMNWETLFGKRDWVDKLKLGRLNPELIQDKKYISSWNEFSRFQKICWTYKTQYEIMLNNIKNDPNARIFKFEELFHSENRYEQLKELLEFITSFNTRQFKYYIPEDILEKRIHQNISYVFPPYNFWTKEQKNQYLEICQNIAKKLNYHD